MANDDFARLERRMDTPVKLEDQRTDGRIAELEKALGEKEVWLNAFSSENKMFREKMEGAYTERNRLVAFLADIFPASVFEDKGDDETPPSSIKTVYIDTPAGQMSWHFMPRDEHLFMHLPDFTGQYDGHTTEEKYRRLDTLGREFVFDFTERADEDEKTPGQVMELVLEEGKAHEAPGVKSATGKSLPASCTAIIRRLGAGPDRRKDLTNTFGIMAVDRLLDLGLVRFVPHLAGRIELTEAGRAKLVEAGWLV